MRVVFDTNIVLSALVFGRQLAWLCGVWARGLAIPIVCRETTAELLRALAYPKFKLTPIERDLLLAEYLPFAETAQLPGSLPVLPVACRDRDDVVFIQLALAVKPADGEPTDGYCARDARCAAPARALRRGPFDKLRSAPAAAGRWTPRCRTGCPSTGSGELGGRTVGLVGFGAVPRALTPALVALGCRLLYTARAEARRAGRVPSPAGAAGGSRHRL
ncbi:MAG TPA: PIN domain-containing protein, partial [Stellaceae bacterium]|nr:PIN domain-containing protein [Stellaceae bacterium]